MTPALIRCEVWSDYQCASGARLAVLPLADITELKIVERTTRDDDGILRFSKEASAYASLALGTAVRILFDDGSFSEFRVQRIADESRSARLVTVGLRSPLQDLMTAGALLSETTSTVVSVELEWKALTPATVLAKILAFCPGYWSAGTVTPTIPVNLAPSAWMPLRALRELVIAIRGQGVDCELDYRRNGTSGYYVDLVSAIGASVAALDVRTGKNLLGTSRTQDRDAYAVEVVPLGLGSPRATMAHAYFEVTAKAGSTLTVQSPVVGGDLIKFTGQFDGLYLVDDAGARQLISSSTVAPQQFAVASAANVTAGRWYRIALTSTGDEMVRLRKDPATSGPIQIIESSSLDGTTNVLTNPAQRVWTGASSVPADGWVAQNITVTKTTTTGLWVYGGQSTRVVATGANGTLDSPTTNIYVPGWATAVSYSLWIRITAAAASIEVRFSRDGATQNAQSLSGYTTGVWHRIDFTETLASLTGAVRSFKCTVFTAGGSSADCYVDAAQVAFTTAAEPFVEGSNPSRLLSLANRYLSTYGSTPISVQCGFADLGSWDPIGFPNDGVSLGMLVNVRDSDLNYSGSARLIEWERALHPNPLASRLMIATPRPDFTATMATLS